MKHGLVVLGAFFFIFQTTSFGSDSRIAEPGQVSVSYDAEMVDSAGGVQKIWVTALLHDGKTIIASRSLTGISAMSVYQTMKGAVAGRLKSAKAGRKKVRLAIDVFESGSSQAFRSAAFITD